MTEEMQISKAYEPDTKFADIGWAKYEMEILSEDATAEMAIEMQKLFTTAPLTILKKSKSGEKEVDIIPMIKRIRVTTDPGKPARIHVSAILRAGTEHLNPELIIKTAKERLGILTKDPATESYSILRTHVYLEDGETEFR